jgi:hypothetical protein
MRLLLLLPSLAFLLAACSLPSLPFLPGGSSSQTSSRLVYDGVTWLEIRSGETLAGTTVAYQGKSPDGRALVLINGLQAIKTTGDSVNWSGSLASNSSVELGLRVITFDESVMRLFGSVHIEVLEPQPQPADPAPALLADYTLPVTYNVPRGKAIPGSVVIYQGENALGAEFANLDQYAYRQQFDSVVWQGRLRDRIALRLDLRVISYSAEGVNVGGTARIMFEP